MRISYLRAILWGFRIFGRAKLWEILRFSRRSRLHVSMLLLSSRTSCGQDGSPLPTYLSFYQRKEDFAISISGTGISGLNPIGANTTMLIWQNKLRSWSSATNPLPRTSLNQSKHHQPRERNHPKRTSDQK